MKKLLFFAFCGALFCVHFARADDVDAARAAARGLAAPTAQTQSQRNETVAARGGAASGQSAQKTAPQTPIGRSAEEAARTATQRSATSGVVAPRVAAGPKVAERTVRSAASQQVAPRSAIPLISPAVMPSGQVSRSARPIANSMQGVPQSKLARSATTARSVGAPTVGYKACRDIYFGCMDEFCANKNSQLKRCACSARVHEFDSVKKTLNEVEERMLDFSERLLVVNMDKEDAAAMSLATEGELAFQQKDKSESQKMLDSIMKKLQSATAETNENRNLSAITLSMDVNVFDTIDSTMGTETVAKEGEALYRAALPVCIEMAEEVCEADEIQTVQNAYKMSIEQDCNTVAKTYAGLKDKASEKVREASALLDISRLNNYQSRNADDILTCKKKMLDALQDQAVCGENLGKCLDWSGKYINPATGSAILTLKDGKANDLTSLGDMIRRPTGDEKWTRQPGNDKFVQFLNTKRKYIAPAMKNCETLESAVWTMFLEDALAQIKLAQGRKLEDMRQSCTVLTTDCLNTAGRSLVDFDSRALSIFGVDYDRNVNQVCSELKSACVALMNGAEIDTSWGEAMDYLATAKTLDQIVTTCIEVGKNCIIRNCMNMESKFGLCQEKNSVMRTNIFTRNLCWNEVSACVRSAGGGVLANIISDTGKFGVSDGTDIVETFTLPLPSSSSLIASLSPSVQYISEFSGPPLQLYKKITTGTTYAYPNVDRDSSNLFIPDMSKAGIWLWCQADGNNDICRITERIWGNCTMNPTDLEQGKNGNPISKIITQGPYKNTLLSWFADNTSDVCSALECDPGYIMLLGATRCQPEGNLLIRNYDLETTNTGSNEYCPVMGRHIPRQSGEPQLPSYYNDLNNPTAIENNDNFMVVDVSGSSGQSNKDVWLNCCGSENYQAKIDGLGNCCDDSNAVSGLAKGFFGTDNNVNQNICSKARISITVGTDLVGESITATVAPNHEFEGITTGWQLVCIGGKVDWYPQQAPSAPPTGFPNGQEARCDGKLIVVNINTNYIRYSTPLNGAAKRNVSTRYVLNDILFCEYQCSGSSAACKWELCSKSAGCGVPGKRPNIDECEKVGGDNTTSPAGYPVKIVFQ